MRFCSLGSGSEGNGLLVESRRAGDGRPLRVLLDCGFTLKEVRLRLERLALEPAAIDAVLVTHEHGDHVRGAFRLSDALGIPLHITHGSARVGNGEPARRAHDAGRLKVVTPGRPFEIDGLRIEPFVVPHDAREPVQFVFDDGQVRLGVLTDLGHVTPHVVSALARLDCLVLEANHDPSMLDASDYPPALKRRIAGAYGHLANDTAARLLASIDQSRLRRVLAAHLSRSNNRPELAQHALARAWGVTDEVVRVVDQDEGIGWVEV